MTKPILRLQNVCKNFGGVVAADEVSFSVEPGEIHGLIGPNGAGKTTLLNLISGIYEVDSGDIFFNEENITAIPDYKRARMGISRTFQSPRFLQRSNIRENLQIATDLKMQVGFFKSFLGRKDSEYERELKEMMEIAAFEIRPKDDTSSLSYGQRKLLEIVRAMLAHPKAMLVDEPAAGLNGSEQDKAMALLRLAAKRDIGVILIEHSMDMIMNTCHNITVLNFGKVIAEGMPQEISRDPQVIEAYLGRSDDDA
ncbi:MAG: ABC transporter ATP-binding protein [Christensenellales bacterium]|jgi:branched-chain amino acid transport system ATP-binding protein